VLLLTHRREILKQTSFKVPIDHGLIQAGLNADLSYPVQIASVQTLWARCMRSDKLSLPAADVLIVDEAHHVAARTWQRLLEQYPKAQLIGLTATPCRGDGRGLGNYFDRLIEGPQIPELIKQKHLVPTVYYAPATPDLKGVETRQVDYVIGQLADRMNRDDLVGDIVSNWHKFGQRRKSLVFWVDVAHSVHVKNEFVKSEVRPAPGKTNLILIDHSGAVFRHGLLEDPIKWTLDVTKRAENPTHDKRGGQTIFRLVECSQCGALRTGGEACEHCGFLPERRPDAIIFSEGELALVDRNSRTVRASSDPHERMRWMAELTYICQQRQYNPGWARHKYREKFGDWPPYGAVPPKEPSREVLSWVRSRQIAFAKAQQKATAA
jgi:hypothetical protein